MQEIRLLAQSRIASTRKWIVDAGKVYFGHVKFDRSTLEDQGQWMLRKKTQRILRLVILHKNGLNFFII